jgi:hypothetical protein
MKLKSALIISFALIALTQISNAQMKVEFGAKGGLNVTGLALSGEGKLSGAKYNNLKGFHAGAYALMRFGKLGIQPEIVYSKQGQIYNIPNYSNLRTNLTYINIPIIVKYYLTGGLNLQAGPQLSILASAKGDLVPVYAGGGFGPPTLNSDLKSYLNSTDFSFAFGFGIDMPLGINITMRYNIGLTNINKYKGASASSPSANSPSFSTAYAQNQAFQLSLGYRFLKIGK